jgi:hypothetical protein
MTKLGSFWNLRSERGSDDDHLPRAIKRRQLPARELLRQTKVLILERIVRLGFAQELAIRVASIALNGVDTDITEGS